MTLPVLTIFDTMSGAKKPLTPLTPGHIGLYVCGVTVYDLTHIGHARVYVTFDVITRYMKHRGYSVKYVRNFTDVDDKIIKRAAENGEDPLALSARFIDAFARDMGELGCLPVDAEPKVSTHIHEIIELIEKLIANGNAYAVEGGDVFYAVDSFSEYGKLSGMKLDELRAGERVAVDTRKKNPADFALWKSVKPGEPSWPSPWGDGRPGWHIECSAMSCKHLGESFDIHGGGKDLVFPHHENEIAQSEGASGKTYAGTWMHMGLVNVDGEKMSKSLGNFWTVRDVLDAFHPEGVRYFLLSAHYRKPTSYSQQNLELASGRIEYLYRTLHSLRSLWQTIEEPDQRDTELFERLTSELYAGMDDDFNSALALAVIADAARTTNELLATKKLARKPEALARLAALDDFFGIIADVFGILGGDPATRVAELRNMHAARLNLDTATVDRLIAERTAAREAKDWARADEIRGELATLCVDVMDTPTGTDWRIVVPADEDESPTDAG